jgi:hypothetical protein
MTRHLQSIPTKIEQTNVTLRQLAGEYESDAEIDYALRKQLGNSAFYLCAANIYGLNDHEPLADPIVGVGGGVLAHYDGLRTVSVERRKKMNRHLGAVSLEQRTLVCFSVLDAQEAGVPDGTYDVSVGDIMTSVGVVLDEDVIVTPVEILAGGCQALLDEGERAVLRIVK